MNKLPAFQTIKHALKAVFQFRNAGTRIGLPWVLVLAVVSVLDRIFSAAPDPADGAANMMTFQARWNFLSRPSAW